MSCSDDLSPSQNYAERKVADLVKFYNENPKYHSYDFLLALREKMCLNCGDLNPDCYCMRDE